MCFILVTFDELQPPDSIDIFQYIEFLGKFESFGNQLIITIAYQSLLEVGWLLPNRHTLLFHLHLI
jgi:hypothetical protein